RPLTMVDGTRGFAEVFFTDVRVPVGNVVGGVDNGWAVAMSTLGFERGAVFGDHAKFSGDVADLAALIAARGLDDDAQALDELGRVLVQTEVYRANVHRLAARAEAGGELDSTASINKVFWTEMQHDIFDTGIRLLAEDGAVVGDPGALPDADPATLRAWSRWHHRYWYARAAMIFGGTNEIQRNIISERVLGLPMEPRR
ncbi:acyl-CoA dehydrogenase family protein, partial [Lentzea sp.]